MSQDRLCEYAMVTNVLLSFYKILRNRVPFSLLLNNKRIFKIHNRTQILSEFELSPSTPMFSEYSINITYYQFLVDTVSCGHSIIVHAWILLRVCIIFSKIFLCIIRSNF
jgi:hypothetical protein